MTVRELLRGGEVERIEGDEAVEIAGLHYDSRQVRPGFMFFGLARDAEENRCNIQDAVSRGARAVVVRNWEVAATARPAPTIIEGPRLRALMALAASRFYDAPSERLELIGVTGTSGKTTTTYLLASIFEAAGTAAGIIGTVGGFCGARKIYGGLTTPESIDFEAALAEMERSGVRRVAAELSSIGIVEGRAEALKLRGCVFTNLGRDHLDYHGTLENYFAAKLRLFTELLAKSGRQDSFAVVRGDDPFGRRLLDLVKGRKLSFGFDRSLDVHPLSYRADLAGIRASIEAAGHRLEVSSPLIGELNLLNILGAVAVSVALGIGVEALAEGVRRCPGAPGRMEAVTARPEVCVLVDYAHKPDALEAVLRSLRSLTPGRIVCVFGCGGDRDRGKRPLMGAIAARLADVPIVTSDNPRSENPLTIIAEIEAGLTGAGLKRLGRERAGSEPGYLVEPDRRRAIRLALELGAPGDVVIIAGKGHEDYQIVGSRRLHFDDREAARQVGAELGWTQ